MAELTTPITTQEDLDKIITERLKRDRETRAKRYEGWLSPEDAAQQTSDLQKQIDTLTAEAEGNKKTIAQQEASIKQYETASVKSRIADEIGLDRRLINRLSGETEDDIRKDAEGLKQLFGAVQQPPIDKLGSTEPQGSDSEYRALLASMKGE